MSSAGAGGDLSRSAIVADTASGHHLLTIHGYSRTKGIPTGKRVKSNPFTIGGHRWRIDYYPNGVNSEVAEYIALRLMLDEDITETVKAQWDICLAGKEEEANQLAWMASASVDNFVSGKGWLYSTFVKREELERSKHLSNDSFTVRCDIVVVRGCRAVAFVSVPPCDLRRHLGELLDTQRGSDVVFEVGGEIFASHRCVLAARSPVFDAELFGPMKEGSTSPGVVVCLEEMEAEVFRALLRFAYTGSLPDMRKEDESATCQHLLVSADRYGMERLKLVCEEKLCEYIDLGSATTILALAYQHRCEGLKKACFNFLAAPATLTAVMDTDGFQHLSQSCPSASAVLELMAMTLAHSHGGDSGGV